MARIIFAIGLVALILIVWYLLQPIGSDIRTLRKATLEYAKCIDAHREDINAIMRDLGNVTSYNDLEFNQYRAKIKLNEIQGACLDQSGFKTLVERHLAASSLTDAEKVTIEKELREARTVDDLERIEKIIELSDERR